MAGNCPEDAFRILKKQTDMGKNIIFSVLVKMNKHKVEEGAHDL